MDLLRATYDKIREQHPKLTFESYEVVKLVNDYRLYWKPRRVKTILLAESHVYTHDAETENRHRLNLPGYPDRYVRFVYNLSYGQQQPLEYPVSNNKGTPQFWKLFNEAVGGSFRVINNRDQADKLAQKIELLCCMREQGIWLLDCSIVGLYHNGEKPLPNEMRDILFASWQHYGKAVVEQEQPENIVVIGSTIHQLLQGELKPRCRHLDWIHQPNARLTAEVRRGIGHVGFKWI